MADVPLLETAALLHGCLNGGTEADSIFGRRVLRLYVEIFW
jgi:hypothetical protein